MHEICIRNLFDLNIYCEHKIYKEDQEKRMEATA